MRQPRSGPFYICSVGGPPAAAFAKVSIAKSFQGYVLKHTVEPSITYRYQTGVNDFSQIIRFDQRDILVDTNKNWLRNHQPALREKIKVHGQMLSEPEV